MSLLEPSHSSPSLLSSSSGAAFFTSGVLCLAATSAVLVFAVTANAAHAFLLYAEQALYATNVTAYMTLICSPGIMAAMLVSAWLGPLALALLPLLPGLVYRNRLFPWPGQTGNFYQSVYFNNIMALTNKLSE